MLAGIEEAFISNPFCDSPQGAKHLTLKLQHGSSDTDGQIAFSNVFDVQHMYERVIPSPRNDKMEWYQSAGCTVDCRCFERKCWVVDQENPAGWYVNLECTLDAMGGINLRSNRKLIVTYRSTDSR